MRHVADAEARREVATLIEELVKLGGVAGLNLAKLSYLLLRFRQPPRRHRVGHQGGWL